MKLKTLTFTLLALLITCSAFAERQIWTPDEPVINAVEIAASGTTSSTAINLSKMASKGFFGGTLVVTGDGTVTLDFLVSHSTANPPPSASFYDPESSTDIATGWTKTSGNASNGKGAMSFNPIVCEWIKIRATETGGVNSATVTFTPSIQ